MPSLLPDSVAAYHPLIGLILLFLLFAGFVVERLPPVVVATLGALIMLLLGFISTDELLGVFSNPAPITIAAMFVISGALVRTGYRVAPPSPLFPRLELPEAEDAG